MDPDLLDRARQLEGNLGARRGNECEPLHRSAGRFRELRQLGTKFSTAGPARREPKLSLPDTPCRAASSYLLIFPVAADVADTEPPVLVAFTAARSRKVRSSDVTT